MYAGGRQRPSGGSRRGHGELMSTSRLGEHADATRSDEQTDDDEHHAPEDLAAEEGEHARDHQYDGENPEQKFHVDASTRSVAGETFARVAAPLLTTEAIAVGRLACGPPSRFVEAAARDQLERGPGAAAGPGSAHAGRVEGAHRPVQADRLGGVASPRRRRTRHRGRPCQRWARPERRGVRGEPGCGLRGCGVGSRDHGPRSPGDHRGPVRPHRDSPVTNRAGGRLPTDRPGRRRRRGRRGGHRRRRGGSGAAGPGPTGRCRRI